MSDKPGWDALEAALKKRYGTLAPLCYCATMPFRSGGPDPIDVTYVYKNNSPPHWHYIGFGLTELYGKESQNPAETGFGFELTFRLACRPEEKEPPIWVMELLNRLASYVFETGNVFDAGHHMLLSDPIAGQENTDLKSYMFTRDSELGELNTPHGHMQFLQLVGITIDEEELITDWNSDGLLEILSDGNPLLVTDLKRKSVMTDEKWAEVIRARILKEGSAQGILYLNVMDVKKPGFLKPNTELEIEATAVDRLIRLLRGRILHGRELEIICGESAAIVKPSEQCSLEINRDRSVTIHLSAEGAQSLMKTLKDRRGSYSIAPLPRLLFKVI